MMEYTAKNTLRIAKRQKNANRTYLFVNPLQAKHMPVFPSISLNMMHTLGEKLAKAYPDTRLVVGFAETATAIGATVAGCFCDNCIYIHTTREEIQNGNEWMFFLEEHSHAVEQKICGEKIIEWLSATPQIIFVDDELSTGQTLINMVAQLRNQFPSLADTKMIAASIMNCLTPENEKRLVEAGIVSEYLVKLPDVDYSMAVSDIVTALANDVMASQVSDHAYEFLVPSDKLMNPRLGVSIGEYKENCNRVAADVVAQLRKQLDSDDKILVMGTEECMYPALVLGKEIERQISVNLVACHSTTRSPIGIWKGSASYPITEGYKIHSFYDVDRETYIYNLKHYDKVIVVSDTEKDERSAMNDLCTALEIYGHSQVFFVAGGCHV